MCPQSPPWVSETVSRGWSAVAQHWLGRQQVLRYRFCGMVAESWMSRAKKGQVEILVKDCCASTQG